MEAADDRSNSSAVSAGSKEMQTGSRGKHSVKKSEVNDRDKSKEPLAGGQNEANRIRIGKMHAFKMAPNTLKSHVQSMAIGTKVEQKFSLTKDGAPGKEYSQQPKLEGAIENDELPLYGFSAKPLNSKASFEQQGRLKPKAFVQSK